MREDIKKLEEALKNMKRSERITLLLTIIIELIEREYFIIQRLKQEIKEYEEEVKKHENSDRANTLSQDS